MKSTFVFFFILNFYSISAQPSIQWQKCLGGSEYEHGISIQQTNDGGYVVTGHSRSEDGDVTPIPQSIFNFWVAKLDSIGALQWAKTLGGGYDDWPNSIKQTPDGGYIVVGFTASNDWDVSGNHGERDAWVVKLDEEGNMEWQRCFGGSSSEEANCVELTPDGGYIIAGEASSSDGDVFGLHGSADFWVVKLSVFGVIEWQKCLGGSEYDRAWSIKPTTDGGYIVAGQAMSNDGDVSGNHGNVDWWVVKLNGTGEIEWQNALGGIGLDAASDVVEVSDGFVVTGYEGSYNTGDVTGHHGASDYWVVKLSLEGELVWQKPYGGVEPDNARSIVKANDGSLIIAGHTKSKDGDVEGNYGIQMIWLLKLDQSGGIIWKKILGGTDGEGCYDIQQTSDEGYVLAGYTWSNNGDVSGNHGRADFWIVKLSPESSPATVAPTPLLGIYPNPAVSSVTLSIPTGEKILSVALSDVLGREVLRQENLTKEILDIEQIPKGLYWVAATASSGNVFVGKLRKE